MNTILNIRSLNKTYETGFKALDDVHLDLYEGEILALLGPNGAGKTTLINAICGLINFNEGSITVNGMDTIKEYKKVRSLIGLVPQELTTAAFEKVIDTVHFSRGVFGYPRNEVFVEKILKDLSLWDKKDNQLRTLSGGMKRRVMIAKALAHEPKVLFLDEPTAGVDVQLRESMWALVDDLRKSGVSIILTTHYIEEAEEMADRIAVIHKGKIIVVNEKKNLMNELGKKTLCLDLKTALNTIPQQLSGYDLECKGTQLVYTYHADKGKVAHFFKDLTDLGIDFMDVQTQQSSLEDIFVKLVEQQS